MKLKTLSLDLVYKGPSCPLNCHYCYADGDPESQLDVSFVRRLLNELVGLGGQEVIFTGFDPLMHPELPELVKMAKQKGFVVTLVTCGQVNQASLADLELDRLVIRLLDVGEDRMLGIHEALKVCKAKEVLYAFTLSPSNYDHLFFLVHALGKDSVLIRRQDPAHRNLDVSTDVIKMLRSEKQTLAIRVDCSITGICKAGKSLLHVRSDKTVQPCSHFRWTDRTCGHLSWNSLARVWKSSFLLHLLRSDEQRLVECAGCPQSCKGGCAAHRPSLSLPDDICEFSSRR